MVDYAKFWNKIADGYAKSKIGDERAYEEKLAITQGLFSPRRGSLGNRLRHRHDSPAPRASRQALCGDGYFIQDAGNCAQQSDRPGRNQRHLFGAGHRDVGLAARSVRRRARHEHPAPPAGSACRARKNPRHAQTGRQVHFLDHMPWQYGLLLSASDRCDEADRQSPKSRRHIHP